MKKTNRSIKTSLSMDKIAHKIVCLFCLTVFVTSGAHAASEAEFGHLSKSWTLRADGSQEFRCSKELTLFTHTAMNSTYGETFIIYNPDFQELKIHASYTKQKDGTIVKTPDNAFVEVLPRQAADAPAYNQLKEMVVVHTGLELGATIYLDYSILSKPGYFPALDIDERLQETSPVKVCHLSVSVPETRTLSWDIQCITGKPSETKKEGMKTLAWTFKNIPAASREPYQPQNGDGIPRLTASTYGSPDLALALLKKRIEASNDYECRTFGPYITEKAENTEEKIEILHRHVVDRMGTSGVTPEHTGYTIRDADQVLRSAYGTGMEKTVVLYSLLKASGIPSEIVAVYPAGYPASTCGLKAIRQLVIKAESDGKTLYLSAVSMKEPDIVNRSGLNRLYTLDGHSITLAARTVQTHIHTQVAVKADSAIDGYVICTLPASSEGVDAWHITALNSKRSGMLEIPSLIRQEVTYTLAPEEKLSLQTSTAPIVIEKPCGKVTRTFTPKGKQIEVVRTIELNQLQYTPAEYNDLRILLNEWNDPNNRVLLFSHQ